jgi:hypothetical protein
VDEQIKGNCRLKGPFKKDADGRYFSETIIIQCFQIMAQNTEVLAMLFTVASKLTVSCAGYLQIED